MLDVSIPNIDKVDVSKLIELDSFDAIEKIDGTKLTVIRNSLPYSKNFDNNWIIAYKGTIMYREEFSKINRKLIKDESIGVFQYALVIDHFRKIHTQIAIKENTEFFIEFTQRKPTISRDYRKKHQMCLIGFRNCKYEVKFGKVYTELSENGIECFNHNILKRVAQDLQVDVPYIEEGHKISEFLALEGVSKENLVETLKNAFLSSESMYGGKTEGFILKFSDDFQVKLLQEDQHDKNHRNSIRLKYEMEPDEEKEYFLALKLFCIEYLKHCHVHKLKNEEYILNHVELCNITSLFLLGLKYDKCYDGSGYKFPVKKHSKKTNLQIAEDFHYMMKYLATKELLGNRGVLIIGRMQPPTLAHIKMIDRACSYNDFVVVSLTSGSVKEKERSPYSFEERKELIMKSIRHTNLEIINVNSGNIFYIQEKSKRNINKVYCGADREESYGSQLTQNPEIKLSILPRFAESLSATKVREAIKQKDLFYLYESTTDPVYEFLVEKHHLNHKMI